LKKKEIVNFPISGGGKVSVRHPTFTIEEYIKSIINSGFKIIEFHEEMGFSSKIHGINGLIVPTKLSFILKK
jgi:hypothetical protein